MCMIWCCRYIFYGLLFLPCVKKMAVSIQFVHLADTKQHLHACVPCAHDVLCYVFNYIQQSPKWSLTTTLVINTTSKNNQVWAQLTDDRVARDDRGRHIECGVYLSNHSREVRFELRP